MATIAAVFDPELPGMPAAPETLNASAGPVPATGTRGDLSAEAVAAMVDALLRLGVCSADYDALTDAEVLAGQRHLARLRHVVETRSMWMAKTLAYRSRPELGQQGLAAQQGFFTPDVLIQKLTGVTKVDARKLVDVGRMLAETEAAQAAAAAEGDSARRLLHGIEGLDEASEAGSLEESVPLPWHAPITRAIATGALSVASAHAIRTGLGDIDTVVTAHKLNEALTTLLTEAPTMNADQLLKRARRTRDSLDEAGIAVREQKAWDDRYLRVWKLPTGQVCINGLFPPEQGEFIVSTVDSLTSPRRGGVRFVDPARATWAQSVRDDPRSTDQLTADNFLDLLKAGAEVNPNRLLGGRQPAVRILTTVTPPTGPTGPTTTQPGRQPSGQPAAQPGNQPGRHPDSQPAAQPVSPPGNQPGGQVPSPPGGQLSGQPISPPDGQSGPPPGGQPGGQPGSHLISPLSGQPISPPVGPAVEPLTPTPPDPTAGQVPVPPSPPRAQPTSLMLLRDPSQALAPLPDGTGHGYLEGNPAALSQPTIDRPICTTGTITITVDPTGQPIDLGREERLFTPAQRLALATRDGGCRWGDCDKPPALTEAHHIEHWARDHGNTDLRLGILLCNPHHRLLHNQGWQIFQHQGRYWLRPPATINPGQTLIEMPSKSPTAREYRRRPDR